MAFHLSFLSRIINAASVDSSLQLSIFTQAVDMASGPFFASITVKNMLTRTFPQANMGKMTNKGSALASRPLCSALSQPHK
jgi:hypothetical protein